MSAYKTQNMDETRTQERRVEASVPSTESGKEVFWGRMEMEIKSTVGR